MLGVGIIILHFELLFARDAPEVPPGLGPLAHAEIAAADSSARASEVQSNFGST
jgi:hypothetical protein